ncbi:hypothetical protein CDL12_00717 [Handroanthus impetiginosus]|uniref:WRKY domain-containing protein n=1 Tax=Handroanthus impetiginosus TaxID=429701 RepID=A0A2G9I9U2_9LAMI|nr:hypothetical protein CDL12_00717 [Handroanthus impetiginosus]
MEGRKTVIGVLTQGRDLANELKRQLNPITTSREDCDVLVQRILSSYENALKLLDCMALLGNGDPSIAKILESPNSLQGSLISEGSDEDSKDQHHKFKKRKTLPRWSEQVRVGPGTGFEGQLDDGYNWRKYGQKDILGTNHPRAYYRCTHRNTQGCLATKQVQRADDDPSIFEVIYRGKHTCLQERVKQNKENRKKQDESRQAHSQQMMIINEPVLKAEPQELNTNEETQFLSFTFPSTPVESENIETQFFSEAKNFITTSYSPSFLSPATSESYFSLSPCPVNDFGFGSDPDFAEIISNPTPVMDLPLGDLDVSIDQLDFSSQFLDPAEYF